MGQGTAKDYKFTEYNYGKTTVILWHDEQRRKPIESKLLWKRINASENVWYYNNSESLLSLEDFLIKKHQFILTPKCYINGFVCISLDCTEIWHSEISKKRTKIDGNLEMWINTFKNI